MGVPAFGEITQIMTPFTTSMIISVPAIIVGLAMSYALLAGAAGSGSTVSIIVAAVVLAASNSLIGQYMLALPLGLVNTMIPTILTQWMQTPALLLTFLFAVLLRLGDNKKAAIPFAAGAALFIGAQAFGSAFPVILYANSPSLFTMGLVFRNIANGPAGRDAGLLALVYAATLLPCLLLGLAAAFMTRRAIEKLVS